MNKQLIKNMLLLGVDIVLRTTGIFCAFFIGLNGCGYYKGSVDPSAIEYVQQFVKEGKLRFVHVPVDYINVSVVDDFNDESVSKDTIGVCYEMGNRAEIKLLKKYWESAGHFAKEQLIMHELGHCALKRDHVYCPFYSDRIMCPYMINVNYYHTNRESLLNDLFGSPLRNEL